MIRHYFAGFALWVLLLAPSSNVTAQSVALNRGDTLDVMFLAARLATGRFTPQAHRRLAPSRGRVRAITDSLARVLAPIVGAEFGRHSDLQCTADGCADGIEVMSIDAPLVLGDTVAVNVSIARKGTSRYFPEDITGIQYLFVRCGQRWAFAGTGIVTKD